MNKIFFYIFNLTFKYILVNILFISILILFINLLEISRILDQNNSNLFMFLILTLLKVPSVISETIPFVIVISIAFLFRNLISNNELISMRNVGFSIIDIFKPIAISIFIVGLFILIIINPISAKFEREFDNLTSKDFSEMYSIKFIGEGIRIKNIVDENEINYININNMNLEDMNAKDIKILNTNNKDNKLIIAKNGNLEDRIFKLENVSIFNTNKDTFNKLDKYNLKINFNKDNILDSMSNYKFIPFYKYREHIKNLKKFNLHSSEVSLYYFSEILKPFFLVIIGFVVMGFSGKFKRNENFFKVLFISILIGFLIFLLKEFIVTITTKFDVSFLIAYFIIFFLPFAIGLYQIIKIETN